MDNGKKTKQQSVIGCILDHTIAAEPMCYRLKEKIQMVRILLQWKWSFNSLTLRMHSWVWNLKNNAGNFTVLVCCAAAN